MKRKIVIAAAAAMLLCGCTEISEEPPHRETAEETVSVTTEAVSETSAPEVTEEEVTQTSAEEDTPDSEDFFSVFEGADYKTGRIADDMDEAMMNLSDDISTAELSLESVKEIMEKDELSDTLFHFAVPHCSGVLPAQSSSGDMFAFSCEDEEGTEYAVILGSAENSDISTADRYVSTCTEVEYLGYCSEQDGQLMIMPIAAGNSQCGIYGVIPVAEQIGYDMSETEEFVGIPESISIALTDSDEETRVYYNISHRFEKDVYYVFTNIFLNGSNVTDSISENTSSILKGSGNIDFTDTAIHKGDALYFVGTVYDADSDELICDASFASVVGERAQIT
ncbi:MAG: hypothetical protein ACI4XF_12125 [Oscillospiraceae bacterium]